MDTPTTTPAPTLASLLAGPHASPSWVRWCGSLRLSAYLHPDGYHVAIVDHSGPTKRGLCVVEGVGSSGRTVEECAQLTLFLAACRATDAIRCLPAGQTLAWLAEEIGRLVERDAEGRAVVSEFCEALLVVEPPPPRDAPQTAPPVAVDAPPDDSATAPTPEAPAKKKRSRKGSSAPSVTTPKEVK